MKTIQKAELYEHLSGFLKTKGIELTEGSYAQTIQKSCSILADAINLGQKGIQKAKTGIDERLESMRQVIHEKTAPKPPKSAPAPVEPPTPPQKTTPPPQAKAVKPTRKKSKAPRSKS
jgi:hypothetical protein